MVCIFSTAVFMFNVHIHVTIHVIWSGVQSVSNYTTDQLTFYQRSHLCKLSVADLQLCMHVGSMYVDRALVGQLCIQTQTPMIRYYLTTALARKAEHFSSVIVFLIELPLFNALYITWISFTKCVHGSFESPWYMYLCYD